MTDLTKARELLADTGACAVLCRGDEVHISHARGIAPLTGWLSDGERGERVFEGYSAADRVIGSAAALLFICGGISCCFGAVMSEGAHVLLSDAGIPHDFETLVPNILNRAGDGLCPMEAAALEMTDASEAYEKWVAPKQES